MSIKRNDSFKDFSVVILMIVVVLGWCSGCGQEKAEIACFLDGYYNAVSNGNYDLILPMVEPQARDEFSKIIELLYNYDNRRVELLELLHSYLQDQEYLAIEAVLINLAGVPPFATVSGNKVIRTNQFSLGFESEYVVVSYLYENSEMNPRTNAVMLKKVGERWYLSKYSWSLGNDSASNYHFFCGWLEDATKDISAEINLLKEEKTTRDDVLKRFECWLNNY